MLEGMHYICNEVKLFYKSWSERRLRNVVWLDFFLPSEVKHMRLMLAYIIRSKSENRFCIITRKVLLFKKVYIRTYQ